MIYVIDIIGAITLCVGKKNNCGIGGATSPEQPPFYLYGNRQINSRSANPVKLPWWQKTKPIKGLRSILTCFNFFVKIQISNVLLRLK